MLDLSPVSLYLLKANLVLLLFAGAYFGLLRRLTFFTLNRFYLLAALLCAAGYPAVPVPALLPPLAQQPLTLVLAEISGPQVATVAVQAATSVNWESVVLAAYAAGAAVLLVRLLGQLLSLARLRRTSRRAVVQGVAVRTLPGHVSPFSFGRTIFLNQARYPASELAAVLRHEQVHVRQWHTLDVLLAHVALAAAWCNPAAWLLRRALLDNLEFLADHAALQTGLDRHAYQYSLLRLSRGAAHAASPALVSHFTFPTLKNRVAMMNAPLSSTGQLVRYFVAGPLVLALALGFSGARAQGAGPAVPAVPGPSKLRLLPGQASTNLLYFLDGQLAAAPYSHADGQWIDSATGLVLAPKDIASVSVLDARKAQQLTGQATASGAVIITTKARATTAAVLDFNQKVNTIAPPVPATAGHAGLGVAPATQQLPAGIQAYLANTYPGAKITGWVVSDKASEKVPHIRYFAFLTDGAEKRKVFFNDAEQPVVPAVAAAKPVLPRPEAQAAPSTSATPVVPQAPVAAPPRPAYYVDGQSSSGDINRINPRDIASINVLKGEKARRLAGDAGANGVVVITTKQQQAQPDVQAFNEKWGVAAAVPARAPGVPYLAAPALAYITQTYPDARLLEMSEVKSTDGSPSRYKALIAIGRRPVSLLFDERGQFISEVPTAR